MSSGGNISASNAPGDELTMKDQSRGETIEEMCEPLPDKDGDLNMDVVHCVLDGGTARPDEDLLVIKSCD